MQLGTGEEPCSPLQYRPAARHCCSGVSNKPDWLSTEPWPAPEGASPGPGILDLVMLLWRRPAVLKRGSSAAEGEPVSTSSSSEAPGASSLSQNLHMAYCIMTAGWMQAVKHRVWCMMFKCGRGLGCRRQSLQTLCKLEDTHQAAWCSLWRLCTQHCSSTCAGIIARPQLPDRRRRGHAQAHLRSSRSEAPNPNSVSAATSSKRTTICARVRCGPARITPSISRTMGPLPTYPAWCSAPQSAAWDRVYSQDSVARQDPSL